MTKLLAAASVIFSFTVLMQTELPAQEEHQTEGDDPPLIHRKITVTATMDAKEVKDCSARVDILERSFLIMLNSHSALNALNHIPGIFTRKTGDFGRADVDIRGLGQRGRRISIMVDGRPEKMGLFGCAVSHAFPLDNIEKIEVVKGPASVLYGSEALGGVVNIITRTADRKFQTDLNLSIGSYDTKTATIQHGSSWDKINYFVSYDHRESSGHIQNAGYSGNTWTGKMNVTPSDNVVLSVKAKYFRGKKFESGPIEHPLENFWNNYQRGAVDITLEAHRNRNDLLVKIFRNFGDHQFSDGWHSTDYMNGGLAKFTWRLHSQHQLIIGSDFRGLGGESFNIPRGEWQKHEGSLFFFDEITIASRFILSSGFRLHVDSLYGLEPVPHLGLVYQASNRTILRSVISKGFRSPQLNELYMVPAANTDLEPERVWNFELGVHHAVNSTLAFELAAFHMRGDNLIETVANDNSPPEYIFRNSGDFAFWGLESSVMLTVKDSLTSSISYSFLHSGNQTRGRPGHKLDVSFAFKLKPVSFLVLNQFVSEYYKDNFFQNRLPSYFLTHARFTVNVSERLAFFLDLNNLLDTDYLIFVELPGIASGSYAMPGRNINAGFRLTL